MKASQLFDLPDSLPFREFFLAEEPPWKWVAKIGQALAAYDYSAAPTPGNIEAGVSISGEVCLHESVKLPPYCVIQGPAYIGAETQIRPGAYIRGNVIVGQGCVLGNACEYKNCLLMDRIETPHFNYVGDSILGSGAHLAAGAILANLRLDRKSVRVYTPTGRVDTGLTKLGALLGDGAEVGCNSVLQPGTILGRRARVMPAIAYGGYLADDTTATKSQ